MAGVLATVTVAVHIVALLYIGLGGFLAWWWPKSVLVHVFFAVWGVLVTSFPLPCPLTALEDYFRGLQGLGPLPGGFNEYYIYDTMFPSEILPLVAVLALSVVVHSYVGVYQRWRQRASVHQPLPQQVRLG